MHNGSTNNERFRRPRRVLRLAIPGLVVLVLGLLLLALNRGIWDVGPEAPSGPPTPTSWPRVRMTSPEYGMQAFLWWNQETVARDLQLVQDAGFTWVKQHVSWRDIEGLSQGHYDWYFTDRIVDDVEQYGLDVLFRIDRQPLWSLLAQDPRTGPVGDPQHLGDFCHALAERYRGRVKAYQVWNEPNLSREWQDLPPDPAGYVDLLRACYIGIKTADPDAMVISAGLSPTGSGLPDAMPDIQYLEAMYEAGAAPYFDLLGVHAPGFLYPPETSPDQVAENHDGHRFFCFRHVEDAREVMVRYGDEDKQIAVLEMGWTTDPVHPGYAWFAVTEEQKADYLVRAFRYAKENWSPWIGVMTVISISDSRWTEDDEQYWWAITDPTWPETHVRPAYDALREMEK
ncbi:MAG: cellulase family glycosylhydrolase [Chloroflexi bacterium]|nr:cellulase family glycosylhydrolase [Chloroflexota bacterium]